MATQSVDIVVGARNRTQPGLDAAVAGVRASAGRMKSLMAGVVGGIGLAIGNAMTNMTARIAALPAEFIRAAGEQIEAEAKLRAVIEATGGAAGRTAEQMMRYAAGLQSATTFNDEAIMGLQSVLATFRGVQGEVFDRATKTALDLATVLGTDVTSAALSLGKALNDPTEGLSRLSRMGVTFTEAQKNQIKALQDSGDLLSAQGLILDELSRKVGGASEAIARTPFGRMKQLGNEIGDVFEQIGVGIMAVLDPVIAGVRVVVAGVSTAITAIAAKVSDVWSSISATIQAGMEWIATNVVPMAWSVVGMIGGVLTALLEAVSSVLSTLAGLIASGFRAIGLNAEIFSRIWGFLRDSIRDVLLTVQFLFQNWRQVLELNMLSATLAVVTFANQVIYFFTDVIPGLLVWFRDNWRDIFQSIWNGVKSIVGNMFDNLVNFFEAVWSWLSGEGFDFEWKGLLDGFESTLKQLPEIAERNKGALEEALELQVDSLEKNLGEGYRDFMERRLKETADAGEAAAGWVRDMFEWNAPTGKPKALGQLPDDEDSTSGKKAKKESLPALISTALLTGAAQAAKERAGGDPMLVQQKRSADYLQQIKDFVVSGKLNMGSAASGMAAVAAGLPGPLGGLMNSAAGGVARIETEDASGTGEAVADNTKAALKKFDKLISLLSSNPIITMFGRG